MIEQYIDDKKNKKAYLSTVEGNVNQRAGGRLIDLTQSANKSQNDLSFVTQISRISLGNYGVGANIHDGTQDKNLTANTSNTWTDELLVSPLKELSYLLQNFAAKEGYIQSSNHNESVANIIQEDVSGSIH